MVSNAPSHGRRLTPTGNSRKLQALDFIRRYYVAFGESPSFGEIGAALGISVQAVAKLVAQLSDEEQLYRIAGKARSIRLADRTEELSEAEVLARLVRMGWTVNDQERLLEPRLTDSALIDLPFLTHNPERNDRAGSSNEESGSEL